MSWNIWHSNYDSTFLLRTSLEFILAFLAVKYLTSKTIKTQKDNGQLSDKEIQQLIDEWIPDKLVAITQIGTMCCSNDFVDLSSLNIPSVANADLILVYILFNSRAQQIKF